ncbi:UbiA family prenyltransferase [Candidatus Villigracilis affinis]|uniref:UbiA family prenyltransferase n=1 Tax=Candidatus Villigracilis affinis TaxID=3140682 RepID=UPI001B43D1A1|nr:UbiA family prenyltransferase [Anaerolineales bacterium]MBL0345125.1 UbiA family prenyltransferase [Anaerolineales bacterium]MBP8048177.1 UbiA family prenyltransferase [Anaerolineales bacterium]
MLKLSRPLLLLLAALTYLLGASISAYLGKSFQNLTFLLGLGGVVLAQLSMNLLAEAFRPHNEPMIEGETPAQKEALRSNLLYISYAALTACAMIAFLLYINQGLNLPTFIFLLLSLVLVVLYAVPPLRLLDRGFGELALAAHMAYVIPSIGFLLQAKENHRLLIMIAIPLTALTLAYFLILSFTSFPSDQKYQRATLLRRLGWESAVPLHHSLIIFAYVIFICSPIFGYSFLLIWPAFLTLPFAILQMLLLRHISLGGKPNWTLLTTTALAVFGLTAYFLTLTFWLR